MMWIVLLILVVVAVMVVLWPLGGSVATPADPDIDFFYTQTARIDRDVQRQLLRPEEAEETRLMAARLLLQTKSPELSSNDTASASLARRKWIALACVVLIPAIAFGLYAELGDARFGADGSPQVVQPNAASQNPLVAAVEKIEAHLKTSPDDGKGYEVLVAAYNRLGRREDAVHAAQKAMELLGETAERQAVLAETLIFAADGHVTDAARQAVARAVELKPDLPVAVYYQAFVAEQDGAPDKARDLLSNLLKNAPSDAPWRLSVERYLDKLQNTGQTAASGDIPDSALPMVKTMVAGLAEKLKHNPDDLEGWLRLIRSYSVRHQTDEARQALKQAQVQFGAQPPQMQRLKDLGVEQGLGD